MNIYMKAITRLEGLPTLEKLKKEQTKLKEVKGQTELKAAVDNAVAAIKDADKENIDKFNKLYKASLGKAKDYQSALAKMDKDILKVTAAAVKADDKLEADAKLLTKPSEQRGVLNKAQEAFGDAIDVAEEQDDAAATDHQQDKGDGKEKEGGSKAGLIIGILSGVGVIGGLAYCKCAKKLCFADKEEMEGGATDKSIFKKEIKSKSTHKRNAKESLVPTFKVEEEA